eukprot:XP_025008945.1 uncharacterized protein LOC112532916 [Gallus gallus]
MHRPPSSPGAAHTHGAPLAVRRGRWVIASSVCDPKDIAFLLRCSDSCCSNSERLFSRSGSRGGERRARENDPSRRRSSAPAEFRLSKLLESVGTEGPSRPRCARSLFAKSSANTAAR